MIKVVKLQHFGTNNRIPTLELTTSTFVPSNDNQIEIKNLNSISEKQSKNRIEATPTKDNNHAKKIIIDFNDINSDNVENKKLININRSKSATEITYFIDDPTKINNINNNQNNLSDDSQKVWKRSILRKQSLKQKKILEWAKKKTIKEELLQTDSNRNQSIQTLTNCGTGMTSSRSKKEIKNDEDDEDDFINFVGDAAAAVIQKSDIERNLRAKLFESELIDLSKARFKKLEMMDFQKRLFIEKQLRKARSLPGLLRCTALQAAQNQNNQNKLNYQETQSSINNNELNKQNNQINDNYINEINDFYKTLNGNSDESNFYNENLIETNRPNNILDNIENEDKNNEPYSFNLIEDRKYTKRDKFRDMLTNTEFNDLSKINSNQNLIIRKSTQFSVNNSASQGRNIKKSKTLHSTNLHNHKNNFESFSNENDFVKIQSTSRTSQSPNSRISNYAKINDNQNNNIENDSLTVRGYRNIRNKTPHVSFYLHQDQVPTFGNKFTNDEKNNNLNSYSRNSNSKKMISLHLQFSNNQQPTNDKVNFSAKSKSQSFRDDLINGNRIYLKREDKNSLFIHKPPTATPTLLPQSPSNLTNKLIMENSNQNIENYDNSVKQLYSQKYPIEDNRFQDLLKIVKPPYLLTEIKDVNKIIEKNDALKANITDVVSKEKINKVKEKGHKLAVRAKKAIDSGEYFV